MGSFGWCLTVDRSRSLETETATGVEVLGGTTRTETTGLTGGREAGNDPVEAIITRAGTGMMIDPDTGMIETEGDDNLANIKSLHKY
jgi:hypothetical protein